MNTGWITSSVNFQEQNQRVAVARALSCSPAIVLGEEPTGNLDTKVGDRICELLRQLNREYSQTFVVVTHNKNLASKADRVIRLVDRKIPGLWTEKYQACRRKNYRSVRIKRWNIQKEE